MAQSNVYEEVLRFLVQAQGDADLQRMAQRILTMGEAGEDAQGQVAALLDEFGKARGLEKTATDFRELGTEVLELGRRYNDLKGRASDVAKEIAESEAPTVRQQRSLAKLEGELSKTGSQLDTARAAWRQNREVLEANGIATQRYADLQSQVAAKQAKASADIREFAGEQLKTATASREAAERLEEQDEAFRKQAQTSRAARESLEAYRERTRAAAEATDDLERSAGASVGVLSKLKAVAAGVFGFVSVRSLLDQLKGVVTEGSKAEQELGQLEAVLASSGRQAEFTAGQIQTIFDTLQKGSFDTGDITRGMTELLSYTNIVGEEFPAAMQIVIDQAERLGIGIEQSATRIGTALQTPSKAMTTLGRQGFVLEESQKRLIQQLEATGRTAEAQRILIELLNESYAGAAEAARVGKIQGLWKSVVETYKDFQTQIADAGVLDYFKQQLSELLEISGRMARDGTLAQYARNTAQAIVSVAESVKSATVFLYEHRGGLLLLAKAYAALKIGQAVVAMNAWRVAQLAAARAALTHAGALDTTAGAATRLGRVIRAIPTSIKIGVALIGADVAIKSARALGEWLGKNSDAAKNAAAVSEQVRETLRREAHARAEVAAGLAKYRDQTVLSAEQIARLTEAEREAYEARLKGLQDYLRAQLGYLLRQKELGVATAEQLKQLAEMPARLAAVRNGFVAIGEGARIAAQALTASITPAARLILEQLGDITSDAKLAEQQLRTLFDGLNFREPVRLGDVALALAEIATQGGGADRAVRDGLLNTLQRLSGDELLRFQGAATAAFDALKTGPAEASAVLDATLLSAMNRLGVAATNTGVSFSVMGQDAIAAFGTILENANATSAQIETAFKAALSRVATPEEAQQLGALLKAAGDQGKLGFEGAERAAAALRARVGEIQGAVDPLNDSFRRLGITSKAELDRAATAAREAFHEIRQAAGRGEASIDDVRAAVQRLAEAERAAVANSDATSKARVEAEIRVMEQIFRVNDGLDQMAASGARAGDEVAGGAQRAAGALQGTSSAAASAASNLDAVASSASGVGQAADTAEKGAKRAGVALGEMSEAAVKSLMSLNRLAWSPQLWSDAMNRQINVITEEGKRVAELTQEYERKAAAMDKNTESVNELRSAYQYATDEQLRGLAAAKEALNVQTTQRREEARARRAAAAEAADAAALEARARSAAMGPTAAAADDTLVIEWRAPSRSTATAASVAEVEQAERIAELVAPRVLQRIERARAMSLRRRH